MDHHQQWRNQQHQHPAKAPKLQNKCTKMGSLFSWEQWQELELQALIYKYMLAGASVPLELILPLKRGLVSSSPCYPYQHFQPAMVQGGYWGRYVLEPEPGRCRRTDGKKWRCSREVVDGQKYCERHVHRGRNRSRKHVEIPTPSQSSSGFKATPLLSLQEKREAHITLPGSLSSAPNILSLQHHRGSDDKIGDGFYCSKFPPAQPQGNRPESQVLMPFFDDWPKSEPGPVTTDKNIATSANVFCSLPDNSFSDFSLKLATGNGDEQPRVEPAVSNRFGWENHGEISMGGPLAEAFRSSSASPAPLLNASVSETSSAAV